MDGDSFPIHLADQKAVGCKQTLPAEQVDSNGAHPVWKGPNKSIVCKYATTSR